MVSHPWVLTYDRAAVPLADGNASGAQSLLATMAGAANSGYQISERVWGGSNGVNGFTFGVADGTV